MVMQVNGYKRWRVVRQVEAPMGPPVRTVGLGLPLWLPVGARLRPGAVITATRGSTPYCRTKRRNAGVTVRLHPRLGLAGPTVGSPATPVVTAIAIVARRGRAPAP